MPRDFHASRVDTPADPARRCFVITPSGADLDILPKAIRAGATGTITLQAVDSPAAVVHPVLIGEIVNVRALKITASSPGDMVIIGYA